MLAQAAVRLVPAVTLVGLALRLAGGTAVAVLVAVAVEVRRSAARGGAERLPPDAIVANIDDAVVVDVPEYGRALTRAPGSPLDGRRGWRRRLGCLAWHPRRAARCEQPGDQEQQR